MRIPIGMAKYSNSEPTVLTDGSIFENLWIQSEITQGGRCLHEVLYWYCTV